MSATEVRITLNQCLSKNALEIISGDDITVAVKFFQDCSDVPIDFLNGNKAELIIHHPDGVDETITTERYDDNIAYFYLDSATTERLFLLSVEGVLWYSVRFYWADGGRNTPICKNVILIRRC